MITKIVLLLSVCLIGLPAYSQQLKTTKSNYQDYKDGEWRTCNTTILYDVENFSPAIKIQTDTFIVEANKKEQWYFYYKKKHLVEISSSPKVKFKGGRNYLSVFFRREYLKRYRGPEINGSFIYAILLNSYLKIESVKIIAITAMTDLEFDFVGTIKEILFLTDGHWEKAETNYKDQYYLAFGRLYLM